jgi:predicted O-linked N-acetylglucosamine transferase (SPINDLY family)
VASFQRALDIKPDLAEACNNLGNALKEQGAPDDAVPYFRRALQTKPDFPQARSNLLLALQYADGVTLAELAQAHAEYERCHARALRPSSLPHDNRRDRDRPLRLGFVSPDFGQHPVGYFLVHVMENLAPESCQLVCYNDRWNADDLTKRFQAAATNWRDVAGWSDQQLAEQIRADQIDILFDLAGHTAKNRLLVFARKPAPIQVTWIGYPGTTGLSAMDYILADRYMIPADAEPYYGESVLHMPNVFSCFEPPEDAPEVGPLPAITNGFVTFGSFHNTAKITSPVVAAWAEILQRLPHSRLALKYRSVYGGSVRQRILDDFAARGIGADRLVFPATSHLKSVLPLYHQIDLALDPFPYGGATTTCEAMWMGVPVITCPGATFAGRYAYSFLTSAGLGDLVAPDRESYVERAVALASDLPCLEASRSELRRRMASSPLCDGPKFAADFLELLRSVWRERRSGTNSTSIDDGTTQDSDPSKHAGSGGRVETQPVELIEGVRELGGRSSR